MSNEKERILLDLDKIENSILVTEQDLENMRAMRDVLKKIYIEKYEGKDLKDESEIYKTQEEGDSE